MYAHVNIAQMTEHNISKIIHLTVLVILNLIGGDCAVSGILAATGAP